MGRIVKQLSDSTSKYYWYPGEKQEWTRALIALAVGVGVSAILQMVMHNSVFSVAMGCAATLSVAGFNFGRRDARALSSFPGTGDKAARRAAAVYSGRAVWRGTVQGVAAAIAAILVLNVERSGWVADWLLPVVPALAGALAHQLGMIWDRLATTVSTPGPASDKAPVTASD